jgi:hypothetical protein
MSAMRVLHFLHRLRRLEVVCAGTAASVAAAGPLGGMDLGALDRVGGLADLIAFGFVVVGVVLHKRDHEEES